MLFKKILKTVNYVKGLALKTRLFQQLCADTDSMHETLLLYTSVSWLSVGKFLTRFFTLHNDMKTFLEIQGKLNLLNI